MLVDDVQKVRGDGVENPGDDHAVHAGPCWVGDSGVVTEDVILQREAAEDEEDVAAPLGVVGGLEVQNDRNQILDVLDSSSLVVQMGDGCGVGGERVIAAVLRVVVVEGVRSETIPEGSGLLFQGVGLRVLLLEGVSGGTNAILSGNSGLEEVSLHQKLLAAVGVGGV